LDPKHQRKTLLSTDFADGRRLLITSLPAIHKKEGVKIAEEKGGEPSFLLMPSLPALLGKVLIPCKGSFCF
jgi:hypothetical protein